MLSQRRPISKHETEILDFYGNTDHPDSSNKIDDVSYFVCFTNRSGSNYLCDLLHSTALFPVANEIFNASSVIKFSRRRKLTSFPEYVHFQYSKVTGDTSLPFIAKIGLDQILMFYKWNIFPDVFANPKFIFIDRKDVLAQAISFYIASETSLWKKRHNDTSPVEVEYNFEEIHKRIVGLTTTKSHYNEFFTCARISPVTVVYEELTSDPETEILRILHELDLPAHKPDLSKIKLSVQRDEQNEKFRELFLNDYQNTLHNPDVST